ncbi:peptide MFS transporter [Cognatiluteimonas profundi]|uniref:peptide MFS transporter n=1 Tax=Cognatiluteimonas profundi TaxID=2594501 RepID=UPI00227803B1|nr:oligopeptide:H+ symporter [Lysobacter profundi]
MNTSAGSIRSSAPAPRPSQTKSFSTIFLIEMWERFGYYGMAALLVLFMVQKLGYDDDRANLTWGAFTALVYAAPAIGGWIGDKVLGARRSMTIGACILGLGYLLLSIPSDNVPLLYGALGVIVVGNGLFKSNAANLVRRIYEGDDAKIDSAFTLYYMAVNIGSTFSMLLTPWIAAKWGWHAAFAVCCAGMVLGLLNYLLMRRTLDHVGSVPDDAPVNWGKLAAVLLVGVALVFAVSFVLQHREIARALVWVAGAVILGIFGYLIAKSGPGERSGLLVALILIVETILFFIFYQQMSTSLTLFALRNVDPSQTFFGVHLFNWIPAQYQALNPIWIFALSPILAWGYTRMATRGRDLPIAAKFAIGFIVVAIGFFIFGISGGTAVAGKVSSWYMVWGYGFYSLGELLVSGLGLAMMARYVPARMGGFMMGAYFVATGIAQFLGGLVANYASIPDNITDPLQSLPIYTSLFNKLGFVAAGGAVLAIALLPMLKKLSQSHRDNNQAIDPHLVIAEER